MATDNEADVDAQLATLATFAVATLANEMRSARTSKDRIAAANSILDRLGYGRTTRAQADVADAEIQRALDAAKQASPQKQLDKPKSRPRAKSKPQAADADVVIHSPEKDVDSEDGELGPDDEETDSWLTS